MLYVDATGFAGRLLALPALVVLLLLLSWLELLRLGNNRGKSVAMGAFRGGILVQMMLVLTSMPSQRFVSAWYPGDG